MNAKTLKALKGSIHKWEKIVKGTGVEKGYDNCPLCDLFHPLAINGKACKGCPVAAATGEINCKATPYAAYAFRQRHTDGIAEARAELEFLRSLLPKKARAK